MSYLFRGEMFFLLICVQSDTIADIIPKMALGSQIMIPALSGIRKPEAGRCSNGNPEKGRLK
jgi:hypothetical protein